MKLRSFCTCSRCTRVSPESLRTSMVDPDYGEAMVRILSLRLACNDLCGWLLHCKTFFGGFSGVFVSNIVCPTCFRGGLPLALMVSTSEVPIGSAAS